MATPVAPPPRSSSSSAAAVAKTLPSAYSSSVASATGDQPYAVANNIAMLLETHQEQLDQLAALVGDDEPNRVILYRFLKAFQFDINTVKKKLLETIKWRKEFGFDEIRKQAIRMDVSEFPHAEHIQRYMPEAYDYSRDRDGNVVGILCPGKIRPHDLEASVTPEQVRLYSVYVMAKITHQLSQLSDETGVVVRLTRIIDLEGLGAQHASAAMWAYIKLSLELAQSHFVEHMAHAIVINAPSAFTIIWKMVKGLLHKRTVRKVVICGKNYMEVLTQYMEVDAVPEYLGGTCTKPFDPEVGLSSIEVAAGQRLCQKVPVKPSSQVLWQFRTKSYDIGFEAEFVADDGTTAPVQASWKPDSHRLTVIGSFTADKDGTLHLAFDNTHSRWKRKVLQLRIEVDGEVHPLNVSCE